MPIIDVTLFHGRDLETRRALVRALTDATREALGVPPDSVTVVLREVSREDLARGGVLFADRDGPAG